MSVRRRMVIASVLTLVACAQSGEDDANIARGRGLKPLTLSPVVEAQIYDAVIHAAFNVGPDLILLMHPRRLPRVAGDAGGDSVPAPLFRALRDHGVVQGRCEPLREAPRDTPRCPVTTAGYVVRASNVLRAAGDTIQFYFDAERFGPSSGPKPEALRFEKIYQLVREGDRWRVAREARAPESH